MPMGYNLTGWLVADAEPDQWLITDADPGHPGKVVARLAQGEFGGTAHVAATVLVADSLDELRHQAPEGLMVHAAPRASGYVEIWD
jgi:hypothetical protein